MESLKVAITSTLGLALEDAKPHDPERLVQLRRPATAIDQVVADTEVEKLADDILARVAKTVDDGKKTDLELFESVIDKVKKLNVALDEAGVLHMLTTMAGDQELADKILKEAKGLEDMLILTVILAANSVPPEAEGKYSFCMCGKVKSAAEGVCKPVPVKKG